MPHKRHTGAPDGRATTRPRGEGAAVSQDVAARAGTADDPRPGDIGVRPGGPIESVDVDAAIPVPENVALFGTDIDGTLLGSDLRLGQISRRAIPAAVADGLELVYVTGRPPRWMIPVVRETGHAGMAICANGALLIDLGQERLLRKTPIEHELAIELVTWARRQFPGITFAVERILEGADQARDLARFTTVGFEPSHNPPWARLPDVERGDVLELINRGETIKLLGAPPAELGWDADALVTAVAAEFGDQLHLTHSGTQAVIVEIMSGRIDKGVGMAEVAAMCGVAAEECVGVGDMPNDLPMLAWVGTSYAVANAHLSVRAAADHVVPSNEDDGVGRLLGAILAARGA